MANHGHNKRADFNLQHLQKGRPVGVITRGTTGFNRLRKCDLVLAHDPQVAALLRHGEPLVLDVGYGASYTTTCEMARRFRKLNPNVRVIGLEIDPQRVLPPTQGVSFELGGFELAGYQPQLVRAFNVLRQYDVEQVVSAWQLVCSRLAPGGVFAEGTCDEIGRLMSIVLLDQTGPQDLVLTFDPLTISQPSDVAARLPKILIHRNVPGEPIYQLLQDADLAWAKTAHLSPYGPRVRWRAAAQLLTESWPVKPVHRRMRHAVLRVPFAAVCPDFPGF